MEAGHDPYGALRHRDYRLLLSGSVLASAGAEIQAAAVAWELWVRTEDPAVLGYAGLAQFLPVLLLSLPAGQAADRYSRRALLQAAQAVIALTSLGLAALSVLEGPVTLVFTCLLLAGCGRAFSAPARWSLVPLVVPPHLLPNAVTWNSSGWQVANVAGPAAGGLVLASAGGPVSAYLLAAVCCLTCVTLVGLIRPGAVARPAEPPSLASLVAGVRFVWRSDLLLAAITLDLFAVLLGGATALLPIFARDILEVGEVGYGCLRAAPAAGALLMALVLAHRPPLRRAGPALLAAVAGFGAATVAFGLSRDPVLSFAMLALTGALDNISVVIRGTLVQVLTPDAMRGRVAAVNLVFVSSSNELGAFESGVAAALLGPVPAVVAGGIGTMLVVVAAALRWPRLLRLGHLGDLVPQWEAAPRADAGKEVDGQNKLSQSE
jgi:hypothetical protein